MIRTLSPDDLPVIAEQGIERLGEVASTPREHRTSAVAAVLADPDAREDVAIASHLRGYEVEALLTSAREGCPAVDGLRRQIRRLVAELRPQLSDAGQHATSRTTAEPYLLEYPGASIWYLRHPSGDWSPVSDRSLRRDLARSWPALPVTDPDGAPLSARELSEQYGARVDQIVHTLYGESRYSPDGQGGGTLTLRCARIDPRIVPRYHQCVDDWLRGLSGPARLRLLDWLATLTLTDRPTAALFLHGRDSVGKGLLAAGCSRLWGGHTSYEDVVISGYTSALRTCPLVHLDERAPADPHRRGSASLRSLVGESSRPLTEKFRPSATLYGCPRLLIVANDTDPLGLAEEQISAMDEAAIARRILYIRIPDDAPTPDRADTEHWVQDADGAPGILCEHLLWIRDHHKITQPGTRFLVEGSGLAWLRQTGWHGLPRTCLVAIIRALSGAESGLPPLAVTPGREFADVHTETLYARWDELAQDPRRPAVGALGTALGRLGRDAREGGHPRRRVWRIPAETILAACDQLGIGDRDRICERLGVPVTL